MAIPLAPEIRKAIGRVQDDLKKLDCDIKWVEPENIHLTLKFLGDISSGTVEDAKQIQENLSRTAQPFAIELTELGAFPGIKNPRVLWIGLKDENNHIADLVLQLEKECENIGIKKEQRPFSPHITIGRIRSPRNIASLFPVVTNYPFPSGLKQNCQSFVFYQSALTSQGPLYKILKEFPLDKP